MPFDDVHLVTPKRSTAAPGQVGDAERLLGTRFPAGYADFVTRFGEGTYSGFVRVYPPGRIAAEHRDEFQQRWGEYFLWEEGHDVLPRERVLESIIVADTLQGDELIFHPADPDRLFVLPHGDGRIFEAGTGLPAALSWLCDSGELTDPIGFTWFESWTGRVRLMFSGPGDFDTVREALLGLGMHDHARLAAEEDPFFELFVPEIEGSVQVLVYLDQVESYVCHDAGADPAAVRRISDRLEASGLTRRPAPGGS